MGAIGAQITSLTIVYSTVYSDADQRKHQISASLAFVRESTSDRWIPLTEGQLHGFSSIWWRHHVWRRHGLQHHLGWGAVSDLSLISDLSQKFKHDLWRVKSELKLSQKQHFTPRLYMLTFWLTETEWGINASVNWPPLVQIIVCRLVGAKNLSEPMLEYC